MDNNIIYPPLPRKHIISPSPALSEERPLALVAWGCRLLMAEVEPDKVKQFIRRRGLQGPEVTISIKMTGVGSRREEWEGSSHISYNPVDHLLIFTHFFGCDRPDSTLVLSNYLGDSFPQTEQPPNRSFLPILL